MPAPYSVRARPCLDVVWWGAEPFALTFIYSGPQRAAAVTSDQVAGTVSGPDTVGVIKRTFGKANKNREACLDSRFTAARAPSHHRNPRADHGPDQPCMPHHRHVTTRTQEWAVEACRPVTRRVVARGPTTRQHAWTQDCAPKVVAVHKQLATQYSNAKPESGPGLSHVALRAGRGRLSVSAPMALRPRRSCSCDRVPCLRECSMEHRTRVMRAPHVKSRTLELTILLA